MKILIVDDNQQITNLLVEYAKKTGFETAVAYDGESALEVFFSRSFDVVLLDVMMPKLDGFEVCRRIRERSTVPIIMLTARGEDYDKILGLEIGADDYLVKPFSLAEVMARIKALLRRVEFNQVNRIIQQPDLEINLDTYQVLVADKSVALTKKEFELLSMLVSYPNKIFSRDNLLDSIWGNDYYGDIRTVDSHIKRLRAKLDIYPHPAWEIKTMWGVGYKFEELNNVKK